jgi:toxin-antitoxin system PIN domain toxin
MSRDLALLDTNVLIDALYKNSDHYAAARALLDQAIQESAGFCITPQVLAEFYVVVTHPKRVTHPKSPEEALNAIAGFLAMPGMLLLLIPPDIVSRWMELVRRYPQHVTNRKVFDAQLVATMLAHSVRRIFTFNVSDFSPFAEIEVIEPKAP